MGSRPSSGKHSTVIMTRIILVLTICSLVAGDYKRLDCPREDRQCPGGVKPRDPCPYGADSHCPYGVNCPYHERKCPDGSKAKKQCTFGKPHCPFHTNDRYPGRCCTPGQPLPPQCVGFTVCVPSTAVACSNSGHECGFDTDGPY